MIDHQFRRLQGVDQGRVAAKTAHGVAHRRQINNRRYSSEILQQNAAGREGDLFIGLALAVPGCEGAYLFFGDVPAILGAQQIFQ